MNYQNKTKRLLITLALLAAIILVPAAMASEATISTDKTDYEPGDTVAFTGTGFTAGETVNLLATGDTNASRINSQAMADENGNISGSFALPLMYEANYTLTATGATSGLVATVSFADAVTSFSMDPSSPVSLYAGQTQVYTAFAKTTGNNPVAGVLVNWTTTDPGGTMSPTSGTTGADGKTSSTYTAGSTPDTYRVIATAPVAGKDAFKNVTILAGDTTPPDTTIDSGPPSLSSNSAATFTFSGTDNVTLAASLTFECSMDSGAYSACTSPKDYTGLTDGAHIFRVRAKDAAGNVDLTPAEWTWTIDSVPPATTRTLAGTLGLGDWYISDVKVTLAATDPSPGSGVAKTEYSFNGSTWSTYSAMLTITETKTLYYRSTDNAGNVEEYKATEIKIDKSTPGLELGLAGTTGNDDWYVSHVTVSLMGTEGLSRLDRVEYSLDGGDTYTPFGTPATFTIEVDGIYTIHCKAYDVDGVEYDNLPPEVSFKMDHTPPTLTASITPASPASTGWYNASTGKPTVSFSCSDTGGSGLAGDCPADVLVGEGADQSVSAGPIYDGAGNASGVATISGINVDVTAPTVTITMPTEGYYCRTEVLPDLAYTATDNLDPSPTMTTSGWSTEEGKHTATVTATDDAGNEESASVNYTVDNTDPKVVISAPEEGKWYNASTLPAAVVYSATDNLDEELSIVVEGFSAVEGNHTVTVTATDHAGNVGSASVNYGVDNTAPEIKIFVPVSGPYLLNQVVMASWTATDDLSGIKSKSGTVPSGSRIDTSTIGPKTFSVTATDNAGNTSTVTVNYSVCYKFIGFLSPVDNPQTVNVGKAGRTYPVKWQLTDAQGNFISDLGTVKFNPLRYRQTAVSGGYSTDYLTGDTSGGTSLRYDSTSNQFIFNWQTSKGMAGYSYELFLDLTDGSTHSALFTFK